MINRGEIKSPYVIHTGLVVRQFSGGSSSSVSVVEDGSLIEDDDDGS
jgi:hypothetical protein